MRKKYEFNVYEINDENDYSIDFMKTIKYTCKVGDKIDLYEDIKSFLNKYNSKYKDSVEIGMYLKYLEKNKFIELGEYKNGFPTAIFTQKGVDFINNNKSIYEK